eukprot:TRINITY_DN2810_c0_g3_i3.p1 TRINITY_DN2810_c0_g3~~TRINITY_DN2810_c0_g3_i3.p1  ORF type:complete len:446 (+),score=127.80 TRINITY_DN2810_c0_g3_i3:50-1339(+)
MPVGYDGGSYADYQHTSATDYRASARTIADSYAPTYVGRSHVAAATAGAPPSPTRVSTYPRPDPNATMSPKVTTSPSRSQRTYDPNVTTMSAATALSNYESRSQLDAIRSAYPNYTGTAAVAVTEAERNPSPLEREKERGRERDREREFRPPPSTSTISPFRRRSPAKGARSISPPKPEARNMEGIHAPVRVYDEPKVDAREPVLDLTAWRMRLNQVSREDLKQLITASYDRNCSGSIDFCDFLALWFSQQMFQIRRSGTCVGAGGEKESEPFEVQAKHIYRIREIFNEYEESYLSGVRYGLVAAMLKDLMYDEDHEVQHYYGLCTDDMVSLVEELAMHRQVRSHPNKEPRYDFAYVLQLLFKYITDNEEIALFYDEGCKVFQALRTKEYGEQPIYQNSTISTKLLIKVLTSYKRTEEMYVPCKSPKLH